MSYPSPSLPGIMSSDSASSDRPLGAAILLDSENDVYDTFHVVCNSCGTELEITEVSDSPEHGVTLEVGPCLRCNEDAHNAGWFEGKDHKGDMGF